MMSNLMVKIEVYRPRPRHGWRGRIHRILGRLTGREQTLHVRFMTAMPGSTVEVTFASEGAIGFDHDGKRYMMTGYTFKPDIQAFG